MIKDLTMCSGILIDGDLARSIHKTEDRISASVSLAGINSDAWLTLRMQGTLPFMSHDVLRAAVLNTQHSHSVADDLESSIWVIIWEYLGHAAVHQKLAPDMKSWFDRLSSSDPNHVLDAKSDILAQYARRRSPLGCAPLDAICKHVLTWMPDGTPQDYYVSFFKIFDEILGSKSTDLSSVLDASWTEFFAPSS